MLDVSLDASHALNSSKQKNFNYTFPWFAYSITNQRVEVRGLLPLVAIFTTKKARNQEITDRQRVPEFEECSIHTKKKVQYNSRTRAPAFGLLAPALSSCCTRRPSTSWTSCRTRGSGPSSRSPPSPPGSAPNSSPTGSPPPIPCPSPRRDRRPRPKIFSYGLTSFGIRAKFPLRKKIFNAEYLINIKSKQSERVGIDFGINRTNNLRIYAFCVLWPHLLEGAENLWLWGESDPFHLLHSRHGFWLCHVIKLEILHRLSLNLNFLPNESEKK